MSQLKLLYQYPQSQMTDHPFQAILVCQQNAQNPDFIKDVESMGAHVWKIMEKQIEVRQLKVANDLKAFLILGLMPNPGTLGLYMNCIAQISKERDGQEVDLLAFNMKFSEGYPSPETLELAWDEAKAFAAAQAN